ncbi:MAG: thioester reductase domain-containing protein [Bacteroidota bacterium]
MKSIITEFQKQVVCFPEQLLFAFLDGKGDVKESYTYSEFDVRTKCIAAHFQSNYNFQLGDRILLAYPPGIEMICSFFACVRSGLIPVPVYPPSANGFQAAIQKMAFIACDCSAKVILTTRTYKLTASLKISQSPISKPIDKYLTKLDWISTDDISNSREQDFIEKNSEILFLQYTSGSTNDPKGVIITHENLIDNCNNVVDHKPVGVSWLPQYHDMGLIGYYLFFALKGGTTYGFAPTDFILRPALWLETISKYACTATSAPSFAYEYCLHSDKITDEFLKKIDLSSLRFVMNAAEPVKVEVFLEFIERFKTYGLNPNAVFAAYGLAENTLAVSNYGRHFGSFDTESLKKGRAVLNDDVHSTKLMSCGRTLGDTKVCIVNIDSESNKLLDGFVGEIWVSGSSKGKGYWNREQLTNETFNARIDGDETRWLKTGDLGFIHSNELYICGRTKDMIIIRGLNYYPQDVEALIEKDLAVRKGCVAAFSDKEEKLVVVVGVKSKHKLPDFELFNKKVQNFLGIQIDEAVFVLAKEIAKTSSGKIRRAENKALFQSGNFEILWSVKNDGQNKIPVHSSLDNNEDNLVNTLFFRYHLTGQETTTLGDSGLDSLKLAEFAHDLKQVILKFGFEDVSDEIDLRILQKVAVSELYSILLELKESNRFARFAFKRMLSRIQNEYITVEREIMRRDSKVEWNQTAINTEVIHTISGSVLLTGGTGFFGPFIIKSLLEQQTSGIYVLVRSNSETEGFERLKKAFETIQAEEKLNLEFIKRVKAISGDLDKFRLGLSERDWAFLENEIHTIYHNGAMVNYVLDYESMRTANVDGTIEVLRLAQSSRIKILNYISTTFIFGWSTKDVLLESDTNEEMELLDFGYSQSKWVSEQIVHQAQQKGLPIRIFRPALISPSIDGKGYNFDIAVRLLAFMVKYGIGTSARNQVSFSPADLAANNIVAISEIPHSIGKTFHVTRDEYSSMQDVTEILSKLSGKKFQHFQLKEFVPEVISRCKKDDLLFPLLNFLVRSVDNISSMEFKRYDNSNYRKYRDASPNGIPDFSLDEVVNGIYSFLVNNQIIKEELNE